MNTTGTRPAPRHNTVKIKPAPKPHHGTSTVVVVSDHGSDDNISAGEAITVLVVILVLGVLLTWALSRR